MEEVGLFAALYNLPQITRYKPDPVPREALDRIHRRRDEGSEWRK